MMHDFSDSEGEDSRAGPSSDAREPSPARSPRANPLRITLRHVASPHAQARERQPSLTPPPPLTLKFRPQSRAEKAAYSSSDEDQPMAKKRAKATAGPSMPAQHRKAYDWLQPSSASASHSGPARVRVDKDKEPDPLDELMDAAERPRKSHKRRAPDAPAGPGKSWRKGLKKGMLPLKDEESIPGTPPESLSRAASEASEPVRAESPFELADAATLGFPVFPKPIVAPAITLGAFPKVTSFFALVNGGDTGPFPRKEKVRNWEAEEKTLVGIGGGTLRFKSWRRGPPSELGRLIQADKAAKDLQRQQKKDRAATEVTPWGDRPLLTHTASFESKDADSKSVDEESEGESVAGSMKRKPAKKPRKSKLAQEIIVDE